VQFARQTGRQVAVGGATCGIHYLDLADRRPPGWLVRRRLKGAPREAGSTDRALNRC